MDSTYGSMNSTVTIYTGIILILRLASRAAAYAIVYGIIPPVAIQ